MASDQSNTSNRRPNRVHERALGQAERTAQSQQDALARRERILDEALGLTHDAEAAAARRAIAERMAAQLENFRANKRQLVAQLTQTRSWLTTESNHLQHARQSLDQRRAGLEAKQSELEHRAAELKQQADDLAQRAAVLNAKERDLDARTRELSERNAANEADLHDQRTRLNRQQQELADERATLRDAQRALHAQRQELGRHVETLRAEQADLIASASETASRRESADDHARALAEQADALERRADELANQARALAQREQALEQRAAALVTKQDHLRDAERELANREAELQAQQNALTEAEAQQTAREEAAAHEITQQQIELVDLQRQHEQARDEARQDREAAARENEQARAMSAEIIRRRQLLEDETESFEQRAAELAREAREVDQERQSLRVRADQLDRRQKELAEQQNTLTDRAAALDRRAAQLEEEAADLTRQQQANTERRAAVDQLYEQASRRDREARARLDELADREQALETRDEQLRRQSLELQLDREALEDAQQNLETLKAELAAAPPPAPVVEAVAAVPTVAPLRWGLAVSFALLAGLAVGATWWVMHPPLYQARATLAIQTDRAAAERVTAEHARWLQTADLESHWSNATVGAAVDQQRAAQQVVVRPDDAAAQVHVALVAPRAATAEAHLQALVSAYQSYVRSLDDDAFGSPVLEAWAAQRVALRAQRDTLDERLAELRTQLAQIPTAAALEQSEQRFEQARRTADEAAQSITTARQTLRNLNATTAPRGVIPPNALYAALADDAAYQEDLKELASVARAYHRELAVAFVLLAEPFETLRAHVLDLGKAVNEQLDLQPPAEIRAALEDIDLKINDLDALLAGFLQGWQKQREQIERVNSGSEILALINVRQQSETTVRDVLKNFNAIRALLERRVDAINIDGAGGTRATVVSAVLRGGLSKIQNIMPAIAEARGHLDPNTNVELDATARQVGGIRERIRTRRDRVRASLQAEADRAAGAAQRAQQTELTQRIQTLEAEREAALANLIDAITTLRHETETHRAANALRSEVRTLEVGRAGVARRLQTLAAQRPRITRDRVLLADTAVVQRSGQRREAEAAVAGGSVMLAFVLILLAARRSPPKLLDGPPEPDRK